MAKRNTRSSLVTFDNIVTQNLDELDLILATGHKSKPNDWITLCTSYAWYSDIRFLHYRTQQISTNRVTKLNFKLNVIKIEFSIPFVSLWTHCDWCFAIWPTMRKDNLQCFTKVVVETFYEYIVCLMRNIYKFISTKCCVYIGEVWKTFENVRRSYIYVIYLYSTNVCIYILQRSEKFLNCQLSIILRSFYIQSDYH